MIRRVLHHPTGSSSIESPVPGASVRVEFISSPSAQDLPYLSTRDHSRAQLCPGVYLPPSSLRGKRQESHSITTNERKMRRLQRNDAIGRPNHGCTPTSSESQQPSHNSCSPSPRKATQPLAKLPPRTLRSHKTRARLLPFVRPCIVQTSHPKQTLAHTLLLFIPFFNHSAGSCALYFRLPSTIQDRKRCLTN